VKTGNTANKNSNPKMAIKFENMKANIKNKA